jgi:hypothetical protein
MLCLALSAPMFLTSCATGSSSTVLVCPPIAEYTEEFQGKAADDLSKVPVESPIWTLLQDYGRLREQIRECKRQSA